MVKPTKLETDQLNKQLNALSQHFRSQYSAPVSIPGVNKIGLIEKRLLGLLEWRDTIGIKEVVTSLELPNSTVTSAVQRLINKKIIVKEVMKKDRRAYQLQLTREGTDIVAYNKSLKLQFSEKLLEGLETQEERQKLIELLEKAVNSLEQVKDDRLRSGYMNALQKEYHGFGPWLIEIDDVEEIPQQYLTHKDKILEADYSFKVPVNIDRHKLRPGMLMYTTVVCIYENHLLMLKASKDSLTDFEIPYDSIRYISGSKDLLDSHIIIATDLKTYDIDYNTVASDISTFVMTMLRTRIFRPSTRMDPSVSMDSGDLRLTILKTLRSMFPEETEPTFLGFQEKTRVERNYKNAAEALLDGHKAYDLQDVAVLGNGKELIVIDSVHEIKTADETDYSYRYAFVRLDSIDRVELIEEPSLKGVMNLMIHTGECLLSFKVKDDFDSTFIKRYLML